MQVIQGDIVSYEREKLSSFKNRFEFLLFGEIAISLVNKLHNKNTKRRINPSTPA